MIFSCSLTHLELCHSLTHLQLLECAGLSQDTFGNKFQSKLIGTVGPIGVKKKLIFGWVIKFPGNKYKFI